MTSALHADRPRSCALILVDLQNDFCPGGSLAVPRGDEVIPVLQRYVELFRGLAAPIVATRDWHPPRHCSFTIAGGIWPPHCIQQTVGAQFHPGITLPAEVLIISKGTDPAVEAYSGFQGTDLAQRLRNRHIETLYAGGLATDYCVKETVLDGRRAGFLVVVLIDGCRAVDVTPGDGAQALAAMVQAGASTTTYPQLLELFAHYPA